MRKHRATTGSIRALVADQHNGVRSSVEITHQCLSAIAGRNGELRAVIRTNPDALKIAAQLDRQRLAGDECGVLHGVPILIKDNIETADPMPTTAGSLALENNFTGRDARLVARLRAAGAVILGKANLSEWANFRSTVSSSGWSAVGGQACNPHDLEYSASGSSTGSAVAVAAGLVPAAIGTETNGSVVLPASLTGTVGFKPGTGLISQQGIVPLGPGQDTAGPIATSVADASILFAVMSGVEGSSRAHSSGALESDADDAGHDRSNWRVGVVRSMSGFNLAVDELFERRIEQLRAAGFTVLESGSLKVPKEFALQGYQKMVHEFRSSLNDWFAKLPGALSDMTMARLIDFNSEHAGREMALFGQDILTAAELSGGIEHSDYEDLRHRVDTHARTVLDELLQTQALDALVVPTSSPAPTIASRAHPRDNAWYPAVAGYPHLTVPMGLVGHLPVGFSIIGAAGSDHRLLNLGADVEQIFVS